MAFRFSLALLGAVLLNGTVLGDDSTSSGALAGAGGERNAPSRGGGAGRKSEGRARNDDKLVVLDSARKEPSETVRKSVSVVKRMSDQSSLSSRNEAGNDRVGVGNELHDQPATSHKAQTSVGDRHGMKLLHARRPAALQHSERGLTSKNTKESAEVVDRKKEFENMVSGIIAEEADVEGYSDYPRGENGRYPYADYEQYTSLGGSGGLGTEVPPGGSSSVQSNNSTSVSASGSIPSASSSSDSGQSSTTGNEDKGNTNNGKATKKGEQEKEEKEEEKEEEKGEKQLEQRSNENNDERETNNSSEDTENKTAPSSGNSAFLCGSYSSVFLVTVACLCACTC
ncbi:hypothetical protein TRVL_08241 [Trypanosoma vivax]|nr:hypothetical protein TRVL_08241 [Trypanosoma vivax]